MRLWFRRTKPTQYRPTIPPPRTEGSVARQRTEQAVAKARESREEESPMLAWLRRDYERNHYAEAVAALFRGGER